MGLNILVPALMVMSSEKKFLFGAYIAGVLE